MSFEDLEDCCEEFIHLNYVLEDLHHYSSYDLESVRYTHHKLVKRIYKVSKDIVMSEEFNNQLLSDESVLELNRR